MDTVEKDTTGDGRKDMIMKDTHPTGDKPWGAPSGGAQHTPREGSGGGWKRV